MRIALENMPSRVLRRQLDAIVRRPAPTRQLTLDQALLEGVL